MVRAAFSEWSSLRLDVRLRRLEGELIAKNEAEAMAMDGVFPTYRSSSWAQPRAYSHVAPSQLHSCRTSQCGTPRATTPCATPRATTPRGARATTPSHHAPSHYALGSAPDSTWYSSSQPLIPKLQLPVPSRPAAPLATLAATHQLCNQSGAVGQLSCRRTASFAFNALSLGERASLRTAFTVWSSNLGLVRVFTAWAAMTRRNRRGTRVQELRQPLRGDYRAVAQ